MPHRYSAAAADDDEDYNDGDDADEMSYYDEWTGRG